MREQDPGVRNTNFSEGALCYTPDDAASEASRCLNCKKPLCMDGCPVGVKIPDFISLLASGDVDGAYKTIKETNALPAVCGRVCPQEKQCESKCVRGIKGEPVAIGRLERFAADNASEEAKAGAPAPEKNGVKIAVVGSGPSSLTCAGDLAKMGYEVHVFEALHKPGGVLVYGIPEFRLPKSIVADEISAIEKLGVTVECDVVVGRAVTVDELFEDGYKAVYVGSGAGLPSFMGIPGENSNGVFSANEFLTRVNLMKAYDPSYDTPIKRGGRVVVVGGGNVAMDAARCAKRLGSDVKIVYRRSEAEMPARAEEVHHAKEEGIEFLTLNNPVGINADEKGNVTSVTCIRMELGEPDEKGRRRPIPVPDSEFDIETQTVIMAIGNSPNPLIRMTTPGLETDRRGCFVTSEDGGTTTREGVFSGGDAVTGAATVILAMGAGKKAAEAIDKYVKLNRASHG